MSRSALSRPAGHELCGTLGGWDYHYDRNALASSVIVGDHALAITAAGHILRFAATSMAPTGEKLSPERALVWGPVHNGTALAAFANGRIGRVEAATLAVTTVGEVPGRTQWLGEMTSGGPTVVVYQTKGERMPDAPRRKHGPPRVRILETGRDVVLGDIDPSAFFLDSRGRLWMGEDHGEWGGRVNVIDLTRSDARVVKVRPYPEGVYGFVEDTRGDVLAFGGTSHMGASAAVITEVSAPVPKVVYSNENATIRPPKTEPDRPEGPISQVVRAGSDRWVVISKNRVFETNGGFSAWKYLAPVPARFFSGRPDAVGSYPAIQAAHLLDDRLLLATKRDGYISVANGTARPHALPNQIGLEPRSVILWGDTLLVSAWSGEPMAYRNGQWQPAHALIAPPPAKPETQSENGRPLRWGEIRYDLGAGEALWVVAKETEVSPDGRALTSYTPLRLLVGIRTPDSFTVVGDEVTDLSPSAVYAYPDGQLVATDIRRGSWLFKNHRWQPIDPFNSNVIVGAYVAPRGTRHLVQVSGIERRFAIYDPSQEHPLMPTGPAHLLIDDALAWDDRHLLLATSESVCLLDTARATCPPLPHAPSAGDVRRLARDPTGRIWLAGGGLFALDEQQRAVRYDGSAPFLADAEISGMRIARDRLALALGPRGVAIADIRSVSEGAPCSAR